MTRRSDDDGEPAGLDPRFDPAFQRAAAPGSPPEATERPALAGWLAPTLWILAVAFPAAGLGLRALAARIATSMPYSSFGDPLGERWLLDLVPLLVTLAPGIVAGGPMAVIAALAVRALRRRPARAAADDREADVHRA
ncbi:hypothetical protein [Clavibacter michiganensis]|uniref:hypothetical protein n=1 Tax=Clavibacter michiganensis TaxID=28447 RepID=UPI000AD1A758|nr:hypothetical protein [Clavibacter michiganensis]AWF97579.1 hypothetical protein BEH61_03585 [Clavibacter michiganensis subsp. insidiosus]